MQATRTHSLVLAIALVALLALPARANAPETPAGAARLWDATDVRARFSLRHGDVSSRLRIASTSVLPGAILEIAALDREGASLAIEVSGAKGLKQTRIGVWTLRAPRKPGLHVLRVASTEGRDEIRLNVFVTVPRSRITRQILNGYAIGAYPGAAIVQGARVEPPSGFIEVTRENLDTLVSPRFRLGQFLCKQSSDFPKYVVLDERLPRKLEALLDAIQAAGTPAATLTVMSGYRTPAYNRSIGNETAFSRHLWGAAADVFVDEAPSDGRMDDLDANGVVDTRDSEHLFALADALDRDPPEDWFIGGAGYYAATVAHGPFVHVDVRGHAARW
jgi:Peptidase M15